MSNIATAFLENSKNPEPLFFDILLRRSENNPDQKAFTFVNNGQDKTLTYYELDRNIRRLAAYFQQKS